MPAAQGVGFAVVLGVQIALRPRRLHAVHGHGLRKLGFDVGFQLALVLQLEARARGHGGAAYRRRRFQGDVAGGLAARAFALDLPDDRLDPGIEGKGDQQHHEQQSGGLPVFANRAARAAAGDQDQHPAKQHQAGKKTQGNENVEAR